MSNWALIRLLKAFQTLMWGSGVVCGLGSALLVIQLSDPEPKRLISSILVLGVGVVASITIKTLSNTCRKPRHTSTWRALTPLTQKSVGTSALALFVQRISARKALAAPPPYCLESFIPPLNFGSCGHEV